MPRIQQDIVVKHGRGGRLEGKKVVEDATLVGPLAFHKALDLEGEFGWAITHVRTGYKLCNCYTRDQARELTPKIRDMATWNFSDPFRLDPDERGNIIAFLSQHNVRI